MKALVVVGLLCLVSPARAEPPGATPPREVPAAPIPDDKSEDVATALTVAGIVGPIALMTYGFRPGVEAGDGAMMIGVLGGFLVVPMPALGHWYARRVGGSIGGTGMALRLGGYLSIMVGFSMIDDANRCARGEVVEDGCSSEDRNVGKGSIGVGIGLVAASWIYDIVTSRSEVRRRNANARPMALVPLASPNTAGLALSGAF